MTEIVRLLMDLGYSDEVRCLGDEGDWGAASAWASAAAERGEFDEALAMLTPFADTGWFPAVVARNRVIADAEEPPEARVPASSPGPISEPGHDRVAPLLREGRVAEAVEMLHAEALVEGAYPCLALPTLVGMTAEYGLHDRVLAVIDEIAGQGDGMTIDLLERRAAVLALRGDTDQAFSELSEWDDGGVPWLTELLLARILAGVGLYEVAATRLSVIDDARCLIEQASMLVRLGRVAEAIEVARAHRLTPQRA